MCGYQRDGFVVGDNFFSDEDEEKNRQENVPCTIFDTTDEDEDDNDNDDNYYDDKSSTSSDDTDVGNSISRIKRNSRSSRRTPLPTRRGDRGGRVGLRTQVHDHGRKCSVCGQGGHGRRNCPVAAEETVAAQQVSEAEPETRNDCGHERPLNDDV